jgi:Tfp pilus assembly pilus retraction ATPase PilT
MREAVHATDGGRLVILAVLAPTSMHGLRAISGRSISGGDAPNRLALATSFRAAFTYRGLRRLGGGRTLIQDLIIGTSDVSALLASGDFAGITRIQRSGAGGMHTVDETLGRAVKRGHLSLRQAAAQAVDRRQLALRRTRLTAERQW